MKAALLHPLPHTPQPTIPSQRIGNETLQHGGRAKGCLYSFLVYWTMLQIIYRAEYQNDYPAMTRHNVPVTERHCSNMNPVFVLRTGSVQLIFGSGFVKSWTPTSEGRQQNVLVIKRPFLMRSVYSVNKLDAQCWCNLSPCDTRRFNSGENLSCGLHG